jgi:uncharacterized protein
MKSKNILLLILIVLVVIVVYSFSGQNSEGYNEQIKKERSEKNSFMSSAGESPFSAAPKKFKGLQYFPIDIKYKVVADLTPIKDREVVILKTSDGKEDRYINYAYADFQLNGKKNKLLILEVATMGPSRGKLFLAFGDETSALETYGAGRYLDIEKVPGATTITLDFNKAYNPYCAYNESYTCPLPPAENLLSIPIKAGEKNYQH